MFITVIHIPTSLLILFILFQIAPASEITKRDPTCQNIDITVTFPATNATIPLGFTLNPLTILSAVASLVFDAAVSGTYNIAARYCEPTIVIPSRQGTLQLLVHGATHTQNHRMLPPYISPAAANCMQGPVMARQEQAFSGAEYRWIAYAPAQDYPTLSIDRLGRGLLDHPDPIAVVQVPA